MPAKVLLIGGTGFLGPAILEAFARAGQYALYTLNRGTRPPLAGAAGQIVCDKNDRQAFAAALRQRPWDIVVDTILTDQDIEFVVETAGGNIGRLIHAGSFGVYGDARRLPASEALPLREGRGPAVVFNHKLRQDQAILRAFQERGFPGTILRLSYIYGPGKVPLDGWGGRAPEFFRMLRDGRQIALPNDGRALLQPGHVRDLGRAFPLAAACPNACGQVYNIGGAQSLTMRDYISLIADAMGVPLNLEFAAPDEILARYPGLVDAVGMQFACQHMCAGCAKAERDLGWRPAVALEAGLRETVAWLREEKII